MQINIYKDKLLGARLFGASVLYSAQPIRHMLCDLYGEENPRQIEDYERTNMTMGGFMK